MSSVLVEVNNHRLRKVDFLVLRHTYQARADGAVAKVISKTIENVVEWFKNRLRTMIDIGFLLSNKKLVATGPSLVSPMGDRYLDRFPLSLYGLLNKFDSKDKIKLGDSEEYYYFMNIAEAFVYTNKDRPSRLTDLENALLSEFLHNNWQKSLCAPSFNWGYQNVKFSLDLNSYSSTSEELVVYNEVIFHFLPLLFKDVIVETLDNLGMVDSTIAWTDAHTAIYGNSKTGQSANHDLVIQMLHDFSLNADVIKRVFIKWVFNDEVEEWQYSSEENQFITVAYEEMQRRCLGIDICLTCQKIILPKKNSEDENS
jgi:hypothetical protein